MENPPRHKKERLEGPIELKDPDGYENGLIVSGGALLQQFIMSCIAMQCCAVLCCAVLCCAVLFYTCVL